MNFRRNLLANYGGQIVASALALLLAPLFVAELGLEAWGLVGILALLSAWFNLVDVGLTPAITREVARAQPGTESAQRAGELVRCVELVYGVLALLIAVLLLAVADGLVTQWLRVTTLAMREASLSVALMGLIIALRLYENIYRAILGGLQELTTLNAWSTGFALLRWGGGLLYVLVSGTGVVGLFAWHAVVAAVSLSCFAVVGRRRLRRLCPAARLDFAALLRVRRFATGIALSSILGLLLTQIDKLLLSRLLPLADFGLYMLAVTLADALALLAAPLYGVLVPRFAELLQDASATNEAALGELYLRVSQCLAALLMPCAFLLVLHGHGVVLAWSGSPALALQVAPLLALLALGRMLNALMQVPAALQVGAGWTALSAQLNAAAVLILVPLILLTVPAHGAIAYAWCWVALNLAYVGIGTWLMHRRLLSALRNRWWTTGVLVPAMVAALWMAASRWLIVLPEGRLALTAALGGVLLGAVVLLTLVLPTPRALLRALPIAARV